MWWNPFFISTVTKSSVGSISWATVLIFSHWNVTLQQLSSTTLTDSVLNGIYYSVLKPRWCAKHNVACQAVGLPVHAPANTRHWDSVGLMLGQRCSLWTNITPTLAQCILLAVSILLSASTSRHRPNVCWMLGQRRWCNWDIYGDT